MSSFIGRASAVLSPLIAIAALAIAAKSQYDERQIMAEMQRQVGNADETRLGMTLDYKRGAYGEIIYDQPCPTENAPDAMCATDVHTVWTAWERLEQLDSRMHELETYAVDRRYGWGNYWNDGFTLNNAEVKVLADDRTMDVIRLLLDQDSDGDGFTNRVDYCIDLPGVDWTDTMNDGEITDTINEFDGCPDPRIDVDNDMVADYRDQCIAPKPEGTWVMDPKVLHGPKSIFPKYQGCLDSDEDGIGDAFEPPVCVELLPEEAQMSTRGCWVEKVAFTCLVTVGTKEDEGGKSGKARYSSCAGADDPTATYEFDWKLNDDGSYSFSPPREPEGDL